MPDLKNIDYSPSLEYRSNYEYDPYYFFLQALAESDKFDLLLGYFTSSAINVLSIGFAKFLINGGKMRMIINNVLTPPDKESILNGLNNPPEHYNLSIYNYRDIVSRLNSQGTHFFECLSYLISSKRLEIKVIAPRGGKGVSHYKSGIFKDKKNEITFKGSCNFTAFALLENLEELNVKQSWNSNSEKKAIAEYQKFFDQTFEGNNKDVEYIDVKLVEARIVKEFGRKDLNDLIKDELLLIKKINLDKGLINESAKKKLKQYTYDIEKITREPRFPYPSGPREYQQQAYEEWRKNNFKGIFAMATGTGKTITALNCLLNENRKNENKISHALILVPTITLVEQWEKEVRAFNFQEVYKISSKVNWQKNVTTLISSAKRIPISFIIISTYASFVKDKFQNLMMNMPNDTIFIADEGHNLASPIVASKIKDVRLQKRIGLSATPKRIYDPKGTAEMEVFFEDEEPYTYSFSMERAIKDGVLCEYYYYPHIIKLTDNEMAEYVEISYQLAKLYRFGKENTESQSIIERLLLKRKRIIHKAVNKLDAATSILKQQFLEKGNLKYTFVYVPEGMTFEIRENDTEIIEEDIRLINQYTREIARIDDSLLVNQFVSGMSDRDEILKQFQLGQIDVIASMKCLDEGVDIPRAETAIFCSSTGNPRQFIQRRGRILRKHIDKKNAVIHDLVVIPDYENQLEDSDTYDLERRMVRTELERVMYFASLSKNPYFTEDIFSNVCSHYDLNIYTIQSELSAP